MIDALVFLQNCWVHPRSFKSWTAMMASPRRHRYICYGLFAGCKTGQVLRRAGFDSEDNIVWENASKSVGTKANACFPPDLDHMIEQINTLQPRVVVALGKVAAEGVGQLNIDVPVLLGPHPAARFNTIPELTVIRQRIGGHGY